MILFFSHAPADDDQRAVYGLSKVLSSFQTMNRSMTIESANVFLLVALKEGQRAVEYAKETGLTQSTISRHLLDLSDYRRDLSDAGSGRKEGYGLVKAEVDPMELRAKRYYLTHKGRTQVQKILAILAGEDTGRAKVGVASMKQGKA
jgi:DNA-binding MarR family transcriptional regulator